ncbi:hypothetical protein [Piscinibacter gummiphilus]|uniref:Uncharacterized protein n=1 Tax=Piscinibacter gummiphilus TaxID=946333 RepID=A0ABZ0CUF4_9BURK|nr:hypothetical protein [Piscinibacter gummiphilus]WOB06567.1 hypothetical protein RXV79_16740 [Piscinibacter gummiphilus]
MSATWSDKQVSCIATYNVLEGDELLNQFDRAFLPFDKAGSVPLQRLPWFPDFAASKGDIHGRAAQTARAFFKFILKLYTNRKERPQDAVEKMLRALGDCFESKDATIADLAQTIDSFLKFKGEPGGPQ